MRFRLLFLFSVCVFASVARCQTDITIRFIDAQTGEPIVGISIGVSAWDQNGNNGTKKQPDGVFQIDKNVQIVKTDKEGKAIFHLDDDPSLKTLEVDAEDELRGCSAYQFSIDDVEKSGVVANYHGGKPKWCAPLRAQAKARPGEIVIFDKRLTTLDRMRQEIP